MKPVYFFVVMLLALLALAGSASAGSESSRLAPATVTEFTSTSDTYISEPNPSISYGAAQTLNVDGGAEDTNLDNWALLKWNVSTIPAGSTVDSASVTIFVTDNGTSQTYHFYEVTGSWSESTTWNTKPAWGTTSLGAVGPFGSGAQTLSLDKAVVQKWVNTPGANNGVIIADSNNTSGFDFWAREYATATQRPKLSVTWTAPPGANCTTQTQLPPAECQALVALYNSTNGPGWTDSPGNGWNQTQTPCSWAGVTCSEGSPRHVTDIVRDTKGLAGVIPDLSALTSLRQLFLESNGLSGSLPATLPITLEMIWLRGNRLSGNIHNLAALTNLVYLDLGGNRLDGSIPDFSALTRLEAIGLDQNLLSGSIPGNWPASLAGGLYLNGNQLTGSIPSTLPIMDYLFLDNNQLSGVIPAAVCNAYLSLSLGYNKLTSAADPCVTAKDPDWAATQTAPPTNVQAQYLTPTSLKWTWTPILYTGDGGYYEVRCANQSGGPYNQAMGTTATTGGKAATNFTATVTAGVHYYCVVNTFTPKHGDQQSDLTSIDSAEVYVPPAGANCTAQTQLPPAECQALVALYNSTNGPGWTDSPGNGWNQTQTPCSWAGVTCSGGSPRHVTDIVRDSKGLNGTIPNLAALTSLVYLDLSVNRLSGSIPDFSALTRLDAIVLYGNLLSGSIPGNWPASLGDFILHSNQLSGVIPVAVCNDPLGLLHLNHNKLTSAASPCVTAKDPDWAATQTVPPTNVQAQYLTPTSLKWTWTPILYTGDGGYYEVRCANQSGGPYNQAMGTTATTGGKAATNFTATVTAGVHYYCVVNTFTPKHGEQQSDLTSIDSPEIYVPPPATPMPELKVPAHIPAVSGQAFPAPVQFTANGSSIASLVFSIDFDQQCLSFNPADGNGDGIPDAIAFAALTGFTKNATFDANDTDGEIDITLLDIAPPLQALPDGTLAAITFNPTCQPQPGQTRTIPIAFSTAPAASFGSTTGQSITGRTLDGSADITSLRPELSAAAVAAEYYKKTAPVPIQFAARGAAIASTVFSLDFDQQCLALNPADGNGDGIPDAIAFEPLAGFTKNATFDANDADGEIDITISDIAPPLQALPEGRLVTVSLTPICDFFGSPRTAAVAFASDPPASFGTTGGQSLPGTTTNGSVTIPPILAGDCNGDGKLDAGDIPACVLEIFDGDGVDPVAAKGGSYAGTVGCDCNIDAKIDAGDITCTVLRIFGGYPGPAGQATGGAPTLSAPGFTLAFSNQTITIPITLQTGGEAVASVAFSLDYDQNWLSLDPSDANSDGLPDSVHFSLPPGFTAIAGLEPADTDGELDVLIADLTPPLASLPGGVLATLTFAVGPAPFGSQAPVAFAAAPAASFGSASGQSLPGHALGGAVLIGSHPRYLPLLLHP